MAFHDAGKVLAKAAFPHQVSPALGVPDIVDPAPADIVEHCTRLHEMKIDCGITCGILACTVPYCKAVGDHLCAAPGIAQ
jgi:hypothetical protein